MKAMTYGIAEDMLKLLWSAQHTSVNYVVLWAGTNYKTKICYNGNMDRWEFHSSNKDVGRHYPITDGKSGRNGATGEFYTTDINDAIEYMLGIDGDYIHDRIKTKLPNLKNTWTMYDIYENMVDYRYDIDEAIAKNIQK